MSQHDAAVSQFKHDIAATLAGADPESATTPGHLMAPREGILDAAKKGLGWADHALDQFGPVLISLSGPYKPLLAAVAALIDAANANINVPPPDTKPLRAAAHPEHAPADPAADVPTEEVPAA